MRRSNLTGIWAFLAVGGFLVWRNRYQIQRFFQSYGIRLPLDTSNFGDAVRSATAKVTGEVEHQARTFSPAADQKIG